MSLPQSQGWGKGSWALKVLLHLGHHQFLLEEEKALLTHLWAAAQSHGRAQHGLTAAENLPAVQRAAAVRKAAPCAVGPGCAHVSPSCGGACPEPKQLLAWDRRTLALPQGRRLVADSEDGKQDGRAGLVPLGQTLPSPSGHLFRDSSSLLVLLDTGSN